MGATDIFDSVKRILLGRGEEAHYTPSPIAEPSVQTNYARFSDLLPYLAWMKEEQLFVLEGDGDGTPEALGFVIEMVPQTGAPLEMAELLTSVFIGVPPGTSFQWQLFGSPDIEPFLRAYKDLRTRAASNIDPQQAAIYNELLEMRLSHYRCGSSKALIENTPYLLRNLRVVLSVSVPAPTPDDPDLIKRVKTMRASYISTLQSYHQYSHVWTPDDLINWCATLLNPHTAMRTSPPQLNYDDGRKIANQIIAPDTVIRVASDGLRFGLPQNQNEVVAHTMSVRSYPSSRENPFTLHRMGELIGNWSQSALGYPCPFLITLNAVALDHEDSRNRTQMKQARATQNAESKMAKYLPDLAEKKRDWDIAQYAFDDGRGLVSMAHELVLFSTPGELPQAIQSAVAIWRAQQFELTSNTYMQLQSMLCSLPMTMTPSLARDVRIAQRWSTKTTFNAVNLAPLIGEWNGIGKPVIPLWGRRGQAMGLDLFSNDTGNYNGCFVGASGSGKSAALNELALSYLAVGGRVWVVDAGRSFEKLCRQVGGQFIEATAESRLCFNPFPRVRDFDEEVEMIVPLLEQMISPSAPLSDYELAHLNIHLRSVWYEKGAATTFTDIAQSLINNCEMGGPNPQAMDPQFRARVREMAAEDRDKICDPAIRRLGVQLFNFTEDGSYGKYFNGEPNVTFDASFIVLELEELEQKPALQAVIMYLLMYYMTQAMYFTRDDNIPKVVIIDEAWSMLGSGNSGVFIEKGYRRARKYNGAFVTGTQGVQDYDKSEAAKAAMMNSDWMFFLRQKPESIEALEKSGKLVMTKEMKEQLLSVTTRQGSFSEILVHCGQKGYGIGRLLLDPFSLLLASSKAADFQAINTYRRGGLSTSDAIHAVLRDRGLE